MNTRVKPRYSKLFGFGDRAFCEKCGEKQPSAALALREIAEAHAQQDPSFRTSIAFTRLTAAEAISQLRSQGFDEEQIVKHASFA